MKSDEKYEIETDEMEEEDTQKDRYLTFHLGNEDYAIDICHVTEIIGIQAITKVPAMPDYVKGVINLRGKVIPVVDVRCRFKMEELAYGERTCIIVVDIDGKSIGLIVDEVSEVQDIHSENIAPPPMTGKGMKSRYIKGLGKVGDQVKIILEMDSLLNDDFPEEIPDVSKLEL